MADRSHYPDSTGSWNAPPSNRRAESGYIDRTEPMSRHERQEVADERVGGRRLAPEPAVPPGGGSSWSNTQVSTQGPDAHLGDPELAAAAVGVDARGPDPYAVRHLPPEPSTSGPGGGPPETPFSAPPHQATPGIDEPTQLHNPVQHQLQQPQHQQQPQPSHHVQQQQPPASNSRRGYPEQVGEGVYRRNRKGLGVVLALVSLAMMGLVGFMLVGQLGAEGPLSPSAALAAALALAGLPLTAWGLYPLLGMGPQSGPDHPGALLRPPYTYLLTGLALLLAAGLAA